MFRSLERFDSLTTADAEYVFVLTHISHDLEMVPARGHVCTESGKCLKDRSRYLLYTEAFLAEACSCHSPFSNAGVNMYPSTSIPVSSPSLALPLLPFLICITSVSPCFL
jgi:hypothetical protein